MWSVYNIRKTSRVYINRATSRSDIHTYMYSMTHAGTLKFKYIPLLVLVMLVVYEAWPIYITRNYFVHCGLSQVSEFREYN